MASEHPEHDYVDDMDDECGECGGEGGYNACMESSCPAIGGEEGCEDPGCWRACSTCCYGG